MDFKLKYLKYKGKYLSLKNKINNIEGSGPISQKKHVILGGYSEDFFDRWSNWKPDDLIIIVDYWPYMNNQRIGNFVFNNGDFNDWSTFEDEIFNNIDTIRFDVSTFKSCRWDCKMLDKVINILKVGGVLYIPENEMKINSIFPEGKNNTEIINYYKKYWDSQIIKNPLNLMDIKFEDTSNSYFIRHKTFQFFFQDPVYKDTTFDSYVDNKDSYMQDQLRKTSDGKKIFLMKNTFRDFLEWLSCLKNCVLVQKISTYDLPARSDWPLIGNISIKKVDQSNCKGKIPSDITDEQKEIGVYTGGSL